MYGAYFQGLIRFKKYQNYQRRHFPFRRKEYSFDWFAFYQNAKPKGKYYIKKLARN